MLVDSHCHLDYLEGDLDQIIEEAKAAGVEYILSACIHPKNVHKLLEIADKYPNVFMSVGLQPSEQIEHELTELANNPKIVAIGETGLDYHYTYVAQELQRERLHTHIRTALKINKPLIIHSREAHKDMIKILQDEGVDKVGGVMHCFTESLEMAKEAIELNFYISFSGIITFKNSEQLRVVVKALPLEKILIETDAPYLAPVPYRGKQNKPAYVRLVADCIAELKNTSFEVVAKQTTKNFFDLFAF